ncbi:MAG: YceI family protein [Vulcanimicrobiaceae bacterium]
MTTTTGVRTFAIDPAHSNIGFSVRHLMISKVRGNFRAVTGSIQLPATGTTPLAITAEIEAASIDTREPQRDGHLKSEDFLYAEKYPKLQFTSTKIEALDSTRLRVIGDLEIRGVKRSVTLDGELSGEGKDPYGNNRIAYEGKTRINRKDYGLNWNQALEAGGVVVGDEVEITIEVEAIQQAAG